VPFLEARGGFHEKQVAAGRRERGKNRYLEGQGGEGLVSLEHS
jgi:hypothetical protein